MRSDRGLRTGIASIESSFQLRYRWPSLRLTLELFELRLNKGSSLLEALIKARLCTAFITAQPIVEVEWLHSGRRFTDVERHDPGFGASVFIAAEPALVFGVVSHDDCVHTRLRRLHRLDSGVAAFSVVDLKVVRVGYLYRKSEPLASRLLDLNGDLVEA